MYDIPRLLLGTVLLRPYVFTFLLAYLLAGAAQMGWRRTLLFVPLGYGIAWLSEFSSINWGFPYGDYYYIPNTWNEELWVAGVPFMDSLSYVFLSYCSYSTAIFLLSPIVFTKGNIFVLETHSLRQSRQILVLGSFLFVFLDIIIDPVAHQGDRWFLGQIYGYRQEGVYFGIPMSNFAGWLLVGFLMIGALQRLDRAAGLEPRQASLLQSIPLTGVWGPVLYLSVLLFNLFITFWIGDTLLGTVSSLLIFYFALLAVFFTLYKFKHLRTESIAEHLADFADSRPNLKGLHHLS
jgi:uncharacterized membrane protein